MVNWQQFQGSAAEWDAQVAALGGSFYQSHGWGEVRRVAGWQPLRLLGTKGSQVVNAASVLVRRKPGVAICWIPGGPAGSAESLDHGFRQSLRRILRAPVLYCRISLLREGAANEAVFLIDHGWWRPQTNMSSGLTMHYDLIGDESARLQRASSNWRHNLKRASRYDLRIEEWQAPDLSAIAALYREMEAMKSLPVQHSEAELEALLRHLGDRIVLYRCLDADGQLLAIRAAGLLGETAMDLLAVASAAARKVYASHATLWALLVHCNRLGLRHYDLSGVDPVANKGVFDFKHGTGASLVECLGEWEWASLPGLSRAVNWLVARKTSD